MAEKRTGASIGIGLIIGIVFYALTDSAVWIALGIVFGAAYETSQARKKNNDNESGEGGN